jgi:RNA polymerase subunit RPABC4/transcription elongation factor Spt4
MTGQDPYDNDWIADDPDLPQARDLDDEQHTPTVPCPNCQQPIPDFADQCPYCGTWVMQSAGVPSRRNPWVAAVVILVLVIFVLVYAL